MTAPSDPTIPLFLELLDALRLLAPRGWRVLRVPFERDAAGTVSLGPYHADLVSTTPPPTPDFGLTVADQHGILDAASRELLATLGERASLASELHFVQSEKERVQCTVLDAKREPLVQVTLEARHLSALLFTEELFELTLKLTPEAERMQTAFLANIAGHDDWTYDQPRRALALSKGVLPWRDFQAVVLGSWARESETWLWGWANKLVLPTCTEHVAKLREQLASRTQLGIFLRPSLPCERALAGVVAQLAAVQLGAVGVYPADFGPGELFLAVLP